MFLHAALPASAYVRADFIQGSDPEQLERAFEQKLQALIAENDERAKATGKWRLGVAAIGISSAASGVVLHLLLSDKVESGDSGWPPAALPAVVAKFWMAADAESLDDYQEAAIRAARGDGSLRRLAMGAAGAGWGIMAFLAGERFTDRGTNT